MNNDNLKYLQNTLKYNGFGEALNAELEKNISSGLSQFMLIHNAEFDGGRMQYNLHFKKGDEPAMYFINKYDSLLTKPDGREFGQTFYINKGRGIMMKEAYNLLDGRSVNKDFEKDGGEKYNAWVKLDFERKTEDGNNQVRRFHENYGFNLEKEIDKLPVADLNDDVKKEALLQSLRKGNLQEVNWRENGQVTNRFLAADPENRSIRMYDSMKKEITTEIRNGRQLKESVSKVAGELTKKRISKGKGLGV